MGNNELTGVIYSILVEKTKGTLLRNWDDLDLWMLAESVEGSVSQQPIELNENQQIVFEQLCLIYDKQVYKSKMQAIYIFINEGMSEEFLMLDKKESDQVLAAFAEWGMKEVTE